MSPLACASAYSRLWITYVSAIDPCAHACFSWYMHSRTVHEMQGRAYCNHSILDCSNAYYQAKRADPQPSKENQCIHSTLVSVGKMLKNVNLIDGRLAKIDDNSFVFDDGTNQEMQRFKYLAQNFIGCRLRHESWKLTRSGNLHIPFAEPSERDSITFDSLKVVCGYLGLSVPQRRSVRQIISPQIMQYDILRKALEELVSELDTDLGAIDKPSNKVQAAKDATERCIQLLCVSSSLPEIPSWAKHSSYEKLPSPTTKWGDILELFELISDILSDAESLKLYTTKIEGMKEGLSHIKDIQLDNKMGFQQMHSRESLVKRKLVYNLGYTSKCLFSLLVFYLFQSIKSITVDMAGGLYGATNKYPYICMGEIITSGDRKMLWRAIKHLDKALGLVKFIYEIIGTGKNLKLEGHIWALGAQESMVEYRGISFFVHGIECK